MNCSDGPDSLDDIKNGSSGLSVPEGEITRPASISGCCSNIDVVFSTVGITRQKDGLTYMDVDYQANINLLKNAQQAGVSKFIYVSVLNGEKLDNLSTKRKIFTIYRHLLSTTRNV